MVRTRVSGPRVHCLTGSWFGWAHGVWRTEEASVAGESPDRSKQHESSAEPTSGSKVPVPDPRLAVARETVTAAARADTATAVFSTKRSAEAAGSADAAGSAGSADADADAEKTETAEPAAGSSPGSDGSAEPESSAEGAGKGTGGGDTRLRSAVAAWVATADEEAPEGAPADSAAPGAEEGAGRREGGGDADAHADTHGDGDGGRDASGVEPEASGAGAGAGLTGGGPDAESESDADSGEAGSGAGTDAAADPGSEPEGFAAGEAPAVGAGAGTAAAGGAAQTAAKAADEAKSGSEGAAPADAPAGRVVPQADSAEDADAPPSSGTSASGGGAGKAVADGSVGGTKAGAKAGSTAGSTPGSTAGSKADAKRTADGPEAAVPAAKPPLGAAPAADAGSASEPGSGPDAGSGSDGDSGRDAGSGSDADSAAKSDSTGKPDTAEKQDSSGKPGFAAKAGSATDAGPAPKPGSATDAGPAAQSGSAADVGSAAKAGSASDAGPAPKAGSATDAGPATKPGSVTDAGPAPKPGSAADAAPAPKSGSSSGVGKSEPAVDQATAIFKRPAAVDQPTTMLKLGGAKPDAGPGKAAGPGTTAGSDKAAGLDKAAGSDQGGEPRDASESAAEAGAGAAEAPAERTSKFVALKPLDEPAPPKARPAVPPPGPSVSPSAPPAAGAPQVGPERTTQQPLPPRPPLDLLAELTNTPPPRQTPVRTIVRRVKIWTPLVLLLAVVFAVVQAVRPLPSPTLALTADETYAFKGSKVSLPWPEEGQGWMDVNGIGTVDSFGDQKPVAIGSVAKAMTAYVILKEHPLKAGADGAKIEVDAKAETEGGFDAQGESTLNTVKEGDTLTEKDAIAAIMIPSANNIARLLARWDAGSEAKFVEKMNAAAKDLGMKNTKYTDPSGLKETTVSTAEDQVKLGNELVDIKALVDITKLPTWVDPSGKKWDNYNRLVPYNNAIGIKTGSTTKAGGNLLFAATQEVGGENVIVVGAILGQHTPPIIDTVNAVSKEAMIAAQDALTSQKILKKGDVVGYVDDGLGGQVPVVATKDVSAVGWAGQTVKLKLDEGGTAIPHEAKAGTEVGSLSVGDGTGDAVEVPVALQSDLAEPGFGAKLTRVA
ncbi:D-alanyl-D-alanine carboxypeptidase [Streptomyces dioscori]|uniref:serine-type D-Ala-D-Ala carboxypeptidase n=1 Tax=Streptomyces dioscori TaxID=2109333 RepID=A0A2P8QCM9_9ACTN|nr:D-alanyl-D-alanine carboxypeptidase [Streptomyces dioscori]